ncbi:MULTISPECIES: hypothetical protein [Legionella]|uniref:Uncharacterized protein n=1 Tax=Legionella maceachernii TaxID=466 RepID=A0A0W0VW69_9GAMM|nr:hypothetical protein [Legionella maceachernii]KTD24266.1 hypothetical protein Lmac_3139 [Legionella maceachernii]SKA29314.1 hypothetical protein SAMN02745128_03096 [Legionella maceachernii]SUO98722.1 Uncharacterised protein [Legionella maceachernii]
MNIHVKGHTLLGALLFGLCLFVSVPSEAHWGWGPGWGYGGWYRGGGIYIGPAYVRPVYYRTYYYRPYYRPYYYRTYYYRPCCW